MQCFIVVHKLLVTGKCQDRTDDDTHTRLDIYSAESLCIESTVGWGDVVGGACYQISCYDNEFSVTIGDTQDEHTPQTFMCNTTGQQITVSGQHVGSTLDDGIIFCPRFEEVCANQTGFTNNGTGFPPGSGTAPMDNGTGSSTAPTYNGTDLNQTHNNGSTAEPSSTAPPYPTPTSEPTYNGTNPSQTYDNGSTTEPSSGTYPTPTSEPSYNSYPPSPTPYPTPTPTPSAGSGATSNVPVAGVQVVQEITQNIPG